MTHTELCLATAKHFLKDAMVALYEYQSWTTGEFPDVLVFGANSSTLYEIKMSHSDFLADSHKDARRKWKPKGYLDVKHFMRQRAYGETCLRFRKIITPELCTQCEEFHGETKKYDSIKHTQVNAIRCTFDGGARLRWIQENPELYFIEKPHLGMKRYFICESRTIVPEELPAGWGLYWYGNGRFYLKQESGRFRANLVEERNIIAHALRRWASGDRSKILVNTYKTAPETPEGARV